MDLVISGINHGLNVGDDVTYSGTVGRGARSGDAGRAGDRVSQQAEDGSFRFNDSVLTLSFGRRAALRRSRLPSSPSPPPQRTALNVNLPAVEGSPAVALTRAGRRYFERGLVQPVAGGGDEPAFYPYGEPHDPAPRFDDSPGTDFAALETRHISVSLLIAGASDRASGDRETWFGRAFGDGGTP